MKYFSLFSGIGGFELGIKQAHDSILNRHEASQKQQESDTDLRGGNVHTRSELLQGAPTCVGYSEIDKYAIQIYQSHFPDHKNYGDITKIDERGLPEFDLLVGGFPCQSFSIAGKRRGFEDTRGTLFFDICRILQAKSPRLLLLENVKGLLSHDGGQTFRTIISTLAELGYDLQWQVLNSKDFGVPQNRERILIVGHLRGTPRPEVFPFGDDTEAPLELSGQHSNTLTARYYGGQANGTYVLESKLNAQKVGTLRTHKDGAGFREMKKGISPTIPARAREDGSGQPVLMEDMKIRRLTPTECERLQGFPDGWTQYGFSDQILPGLVKPELETISDTQRYKTLGNAVTTNVIQAVMERIL